MQRRTDRVGAIHRAVDASSGTTAMRSRRASRSSTAASPATTSPISATAQGRFDLNAVLCGSEGTLGLLAEARLRVLPIPSHVALVNIRYASFDAALRDARALAAAGAASVETVDSRVLALAQRDIVWDAVRDYIPDDADGPARGLNLVEFVGHAEAEVEAPLRSLTAALDAEGTAHGRTGYTVARGEAAVGPIWEMRKRAVGLLGNVEGEARPVAFVEDTAVPPEHLADYIAEFRALLDARGLAYGMFGHVDAGVLHVRPALDMRAPGAEATLREVTEEVVALTQRYGGLLWGEHGKGVRSEFSPAFFGPLYPLVQAVKAAFDPRNQLNPGKIAAPQGGTLLTVDGVPTRGAADRIVPAGCARTTPRRVHCNGNGACFDWDPDDAMCPSWKATRERRHSPKGRAMLVKESAAAPLAAGVDPVAEARRLRAARGWQGWPPASATALRGGAARPTSPMREGGDGRLPRLQVLRRRLPGQGERPELPREVPGTLPRPLPAAAEGSPRRGAGAYRCPLVARLPRLQMRCSGLWRRAGGAADPGPGGHPGLSGIDLGTALRAAGSAWPPLTLCVPCARPSGRAPWSWCRTPSPATTRRSSSSTCWT